MVGGWCESEAGKGRRNVLGVAAFTLKASINMYFSTMKEYKTCEADYMKLLECAPCLQ